MVVVEVVLSRVPARHGSKGAYAEWIRFGSLIRFECTPSVSAPTELCVLHMLSIYSYMQVRLA